MDNVDKFEELLNRYDLARQEFAKAETTIQKGYRQDDLFLAAVELGDFLMMHAAMVTFDAPDSTEPPSAAAFDTAFEWVQDHPDGPNWYRKDGPR